MKKELIRYKTIDDIGIGFKRTPVIDSYDKLVKELKFYKIDPKECFDIIYKTKYQYNTRYYWTLSRISLYISQRWNELRNVANNNGMEDFSSYFNRNHSICLTLQTFAHL